MQPRQFTFLPYRYSWDMPPCMGWPHEEARRRPLEMLELRHWRDAPVVSGPAQLLRIVRGAPLPLRWCVGLIRMPGDWRDGPPSQVRDAPRLVLSRACFRTLLGEVPIVAQELVRSGLLLPGSPSSFARSMRAPGDAKAQPVYVLRADLLRNLPERPGPGLLALALLADGDASLRVWFNEHEPEPIELRPGWCIEPIPDSPTLSRGLRYVRRQQLAARSLETV